MSSAKQHLPRPVNFELSATRFDVFSQELDVKAVVTFAVADDLVFVIRGGADPEGEERSIRGIDFTEGAVRFGRYIWVDSDALRFALEEYGL
jgi:hypothetical protein